MTTKDAPPDPDRTRADTGRVARMIEDIGRIGADAAGGGVSRLAFTEDERRAHHLVSGWLDDLEFTSTTDTAGNTIATKPGVDPSLPAIGTGSHLDSVYHGGRYDGIAGVVAGVEVAHLLHEHGIDLQHPIRIVSFAGEEGARFGEPCLGSKAATGRWSRDDLDRLTDRDGVSLATSMHSVGIDPDAVASFRWDPDEWAAFLELHVEQALVLERSRTPIGLVDLVSGSTRLSLRFDGQAQHSGGTPMALRADALVAASEVVLAGERLASDVRHRGTRVTVGRLQVHPNSITTIPGRVELSVDVRDIDSDRQRATAAEILDEAHEIGDRRGVVVSGALLADSSPTFLPMWLRSLVAGALDGAGLDYRVMTSGASHDAQVISELMPTALLFVPSRDGLSHVPEEWTSAEDLATGAEALLAAIVRIDGFLATLRADAA